MASLNIDSASPEITPVQSLSGWRREFCIELQGEGVARIFTRAVQAPSATAQELLRGTLFHRVDPRFDDLPGCVQHLRDELKHLVNSARRLAPAQENLFAVLTYDRASWERVQHGVHTWARRALRRAGR